MKGLNATCDIIARPQSADDAVGGSVRTDQLRYAGVKCRISNARPSQLLLQQGFSVQAGIEAVLYPDIGYSAIQEEDIIQPNSGQWAGQRFRIVAVQRSSLPPGHPRSHIQIFALRYRYAENATPET